MNLQELHPFRLRDAIKFHDTLNPKLWWGSSLQPRVRDTLMKIARDFVEYLGVDKLNIKDVTISGSNAAYSYTDHSDIDLHIVVDMDNLNPDSVYRELFSSKKQMYNTGRKITIHGIPVECYVQDSSEPARTLGEYSVLKKKWIKYPTKSRAHLDHRETRLKYEKLRGIVERAIKTRDSELINALLKKIAQYRSAGLARGGEFGPENLSYKALRAGGTIDKLYALRDRLRGRDLSIESQYVGETRERWSNLGFQLRSDILWPIKMYESTQHPISTSLSEIISKQRNTVSKPTVDSLCVLAMINYIGDEIIVFWGKAIYIGETDSYYRLKIPSGTHNYAKTDNRIVFSSAVELDKFIVYLRLKWSEIKISTEEMPVMESKLLNKLTPTVKQIADKHGVSSDVVQRQLERGIKVEREHTNSTATAREIALDHLGERLDYYKQLSKVGLEENKNHSFPRPPTLEVVRESKMKKWWQWRDNLSSYLAEYDLNKWESRIAGSVMDSLLGKNNIAENTEDNPLKSFLKQIQSLSAGRNSIKSGDIIGILRVSTIRQFKILRLELLPRSKVLSLNDKVLFYTSDDVTTRVIDLEPLNDTTLERGVHLITEPSMMDRIYTDMFWYETRLRAAGWEIDISETLFENLEDRAGTILEASGYIPSERERNDPRFKTALSVDVHPHSIQDNARRLGMKVARDGRPPLLRKSR